MDSKPKEYRYKNGNALLILGYDSNGRLFSRIEKNGNVVAKDIYIRMPSATDLESKGWVRTYE